MTRPVAPAVEGETIRLTFTGDVPVIVTGPSSGTLYRIDKDAREVAADRRDVVALVATGLFSQIDA